MHATITYNIADTVSKSRDTISKLRYRFVAITACAVLALLLFFLTPMNKDNDTADENSTIGEKTDPKSGNDYDNNDSKNSSPPAGGKDDAKAGKK